VVVSLQEVRSRRDCMLICLDALLSSAVRAVQHVCACVCVCPTGMDAHMHPYVETGAVNVGLLHR